MIKLDTVAKELFAKIRGRFPNVTIGDGEGNVVNDPLEARFFEFTYKEGEEDLGKVSVSLNEEEGIVVMHYKDVAENAVSKSKWFDFLKELRVFAKKRMLNFNTRDITKSNLEKRDYKYLAGKTGDKNMNESKLYGTSRISYQDVDSARLVIKHTESINQESATGRTQKVGAIYIESAEGERFKYPYKHLSGARAMARHVAEGGKPFDDFGKHITGLSEELAKLRKFKTYMGRSAVMAESLSEYMDVVKERIATVKKTVESLQKANYYKEAAENFEVAVMEDVPSDVAENWIDQLTIKQFNEELADVFPYIYKLVSEATRAEELGPDDLVDEGERHGNDKMYDKCWDGYKKVPGKKRGEKGSCVKEEDELERGFEEMMGQFSEAENDCDETCPKSCPDCGGTGDPEKFQAMKANESEYDAQDIMSEDPPIGVDFDMDNLSKVDWSKHSPEEIKRFYATVDNLDFEDGQDISGTGYSGEYRKAIKWLDDNVMNKLDKDTDEGNAYAHAVRKAKMDGKKKGDKVKGPDGDEITLEKDQKTPLGEFILSYYDRETGEFPKGETAVLTMVEKDYGEQFIEPAKAFIEQINQTFEQFQMRTQPQHLDTEEFDRMRELAGLR